MNMQRSPEITVAAVAQKDGKFLMIEERVNGALVVNQPAGHLEHNETLVEAVQRECFEESGWQFEAQHLCAIYTWQHPRRRVTVVRFAFCGEVYDHDPEAKLDVGIERALWMSPEQIVSTRSRLRSPLVEKAIQDYSAGRRFPLDVVTDIHDLYETASEWKFGS